MSALGDLPGGIHESLAANVSNDGVIVGVGWSANGLEAFSYAPSGGMSGLGFLPGSQLRSAAFAISADSSTIVGAGLNADLNHEAFRYTPLDGMVGLGDLPGGEFESAAISVSHDGSVIVGEARSALGIEAFRWTAGDGMVALGDLPGGGYLSVASDVSADGSVIAGYSSALESQGSMLNEAFRWTAEEGMSRLGHIPGGIESLAFAVSADGQTIVGSDTPPFSTGPVATVWRQNRGMQSLRDVLIQEHLLAAELSGWRLVTAYDVSGDGTIIVGHGFNPSGIDEAWIARVPEPATLETTLVFVLCVTAIAVHRGSQVRRSNEPIRQ
ncbi:MAG: PEP-CTERM sorting domain-containing protein [Planctomycetia bacterium]|nr:PEP-CTERM sorting domain-containing protein [Planctomycetia bacterium]